MALKSNVLKQKIKQVGYWNFKDLYNFSFEWLEDHGYKVSEDEYTEKEKEGGKELNIEWVANKKVTDYYKNTIKVKWHILYMTDAEIERDGKKEKTNKGEVKMEFIVDLVKDYEERWEDEPLWKFLRGTYEKYIIRTTNDEYEDRLEDDALEYINQIKAFLQLSGK